MTEEILSPIYGGEVIRKKDVEIKKIVGDSQIIPNPSTDIHSS